MEQSELDLDDMDPEEEDLQEESLWQYMEGPGLYYEDDPIFEIPDIPFMEDLPDWVPDNCKPKYRYQMRQYKLLQHLWNVQLREKRHRNYWNIKAAHQFWREKGPKTWDNRNYAWTETWITDAMDRIHDQIFKMAKTSLIIQERNEMVEEQLERDRKEERKPQTQNKTSEDKDTDIVEDTPLPTDAYDSHPSARATRQHRPHKAFLKQPMPKAQTSDSRGKDEEFPTSSSSQPLDKPRRPSSPSDIPTAMRDRGSPIQRRRPCLDSISSGVEDENKPTLSAPSTL